MGTGGWSDDRAAWQIGWKDWLDEGRTYGIVLLNEYGRL